MVRGIGGHHRKGADPFRTRKRAASFVRHAYASDLPKAQTRRMFVAQGGREYYFEALWAKSKASKAETDNRALNRKAIREYGRTRTPFGADGYQRLMRLGFSARYSASFRALELIREFYPEKEETADDDSKDSDIET